MLQGINMCKSSRKPLGGFPPLQNGSVDEFYHILSFNGGIAKVSQMLFLIF